MDERTESSALAEVVVGTDGTAPALRAVAWAATEARLRGRALRIVHVAPYADTKAGRRHALGILGRALTAAHQQEPHATVTTELLGGNPAEALVETARGADLLVVGMISEQASDVLVGSVATSVVAKAVCPVTVVRGQHRAHTASLPVVLALGDPDADSAAVEFAFADADRHNGTLVVLHVAHGPHATGEVANALETRLQPWHDRYPAVPVEIRVEHGLAIEALLGGANQARMVVATRGRGAIAGAVLGSASRALVKLSTCPVTIVPRSFTTAGPAAAPLRSPSRRPPMQVDLSDDDVELLKEVLDTSLDRLTSEIRHTENHVYRQNLKGRRDRLRGLIDVLGGQQPSVTARPSVAGEPAGE